MAHIPWDKHTVFHTDDYAVYAKVLPASQHLPTKQHTTTRPETLAFVSIWQGSIAKPSATPNPIT
jgi:hypothetical protein